VTLLATLYICNAQIFVQEMTNNNEFTYSVGDTKPWFTSSIEQDNHNL
jgi:hypothetical protein